MSLQKTPVIKLMGPVLNINNLTIIHWNARNVFANKTDVLKLIHDYNPDITSLVETWIKPNSNLIIKKL